MTPMQFADSFFGPYKVKGEEIVPELCPFCKGGKSHDKHTFALNMANKTYNCKRGSCGRQGHFTQLCREFGIDISDSPARTYVRPKVKPQALTHGSDAEKYLGLRRISKETMDKYHIGADEAGNIVFPYYDETGEHVFNKFRYAHKLQKGDRKAWREADTKPVLFGMDICDREHPLTIFEGEIDAMSGYEAGLVNCVSVPSGAEDFTWLDTCWDFVQEFEKIYLFGDNDEPGQKMVKKLTAKLSDKQVYVVEHECKDANELLYWHGLDALLEAWATAKEIPVAGLINLATVAPLDMGSVERTLTGIDELNRILGGFMMGDITVWTGKRGEGKSTVLSQILVDAIEDGSKVCAYSGELRADRFQYWVDLQAAGSNQIREYVDGQTGRTVHYLDKGTRAQIHEWYSGKFWLYDNAITLTNEEATVLKVFETAARRYDCKVFLVDNLMTVDYMNSSENDVNQRQTQFINQLAAFASLYGVHVHLVAHPRKTKKGEALSDADDISGSGNISNRVSNVIAVHRDKGDAGLSTILEILKNRWEGEYGTIGLAYNKRSRRVYQSSKGENFEYGWMKDNFIQIEATEDTPF